MESVIVIGAPGAGKSTVGSLLAEKFGLPFIDTDQLIEAENHTTISEIFLEFGEEHFRKLEKECIDRVIEQVSSKPTVVSLGGGSILNPDTQKVLKVFQKQPGKKIVWLHVEISDSIKRIGMNQARPLLLGNVRSNMITLLNARTPIYQELADIRVETTGLEPQQVVDNLADLLVSGGEVHD